MCRRAGGGGCSRRMTAIADLKRAHRATWAAGDYAAVAEQIDEAPPRDLLARVAIAPGPGRARRGHRHRERRDPRRRRGRAGRRARPHARAVRRPPAGGPAEHDVDRRLGRGRRRGPARSTTSASTACCPRSASSSRRATRSSRASSRASAGPAAGSASSTGPRRAMIGELFKIMGRYLPAPPDYASPPPLWGSEEHVREPVRRQPASSSSSRAACNPWRFDSAEHWVVFMETHYGPTLKARERLTGRGPLGRVPRARSSRWPSAATRRPTAAC